MPVLTPRLPRPALAEHPAFMLMLMVALERLHCTLGEVRDDYWLVRAWRAIGADPMLSGRVARVGLGHALLTGPAFGAAPASTQERQRWQRRLEQRVQTETGRLPDELGVEIRWAEAPVQVKPAAVRSLLAQVVEGDPRWEDLARYAADLTPVTVPVVIAAQATQAA
jgi:hypothetical protein